MKLTEARLRTLEDPGKHFDGAGLYLEHTRAGGRYWRWKYRFGGKEKRLAFGVYPFVSLKDARALAHEARKTLYSGEDPSLLRRAGKARAKQEASTTLKGVATDWMNHQTQKWGAPHQARIEASLNADVFPMLGDRPMAGIKPGEMMALIQKIEARGAGDLAGRVLQRVKAIYRWAVIHERIESNPMLDLVPSEILKPRGVQHRAALSDRSLPEFLARLEAYAGSPQTVLALRLLMLTATRPGELRGARWDEIDLAAALWTIPAQRMKMRKEHRVPLSLPALKVLHALQGLGRPPGAGWVLPSPLDRHKPLGENTLNTALARMGYKRTATAHGFRALFSTIANEAGWNPDVIERQLAHAERNKIRAAYHRATYFDERIKLMNWWANYLETRRVMPWPERPELPTPRHARRHTDPPERRLGPPA